MRRWTHRCSPRRTSAAGMTEAPVPCIPPTTTVTSAVGATMEYLPLWQCSYYNGDAFRPYVLHPTSCFSDDAARPAPALLSGPLFINSPRACITSIQPRFGVYPISLQSRAYTSWQATYAAESSQHRTVLIITLVSLQYMESDFLPARRKSAKRGDVSGVLYGRRHVAPTLQGRYHSWIQMLVSVVVCPELYALILSANTFSMMTCL